MNDYISREKAIVTVKTFWGCNLRNMLAAMDEIHAADVRPVVLCLDCKYSEPYGLDLKCCKHSGATKNRLGEDLEYIEWHSKYFYCADGKRKDEQE